ncbi:class I SAM-dependent methyltransferase [Pedobacter jejuensis]|uniref:Class I SAM-dependent methyltransferase n=1 Tax=Pedobacter jejuensis TaxID=1268550 RepID=A0A3N0BR41_9SPHI|nr:class I SAM-dependent methyltransferase [Pedobacter jejuensis]
MVILSLKKLNNNYDKIANSYDVLSQFVFGKSQVNAQINQLKFIPENSSILIVGGGTGWLLEEIKQVHSSGLTITYVEISEKMITLSKARNFGENTINFVQLDIEEFYSSDRFDVILTPFLFDNFQLEKAEHIFNKLNLMLKKGGLWFFVDFSLTSSKGKWWQRMLLNSMYLFFKLLGIVEASKLIEMTQYFSRENFEIIDEKLYYNEFIKAIVFKK